MYICIMYLYVCMWVCVYVCVCVCTYGSVAILAQTNCQVVRGAAARGGRPGALCVPQPGGKGGEGVYDLGKVQCASYPQGTAARKCTIAFGFVSLSGFPA